MVEFLDQNVAYWHWIVFGMLLALAEILLPSFFLLWLGVAAVLVGALMLVITMAFATQLLLWGILSVLCLLVWFRFIGPRFKNKTLAGMARESLIGQCGTVLEFNPESGKGMLRFPAPVVGSDEWSFISPDPLRPGSRVKVVDVSGNSLIVNKTG